MSASTDELDSPVLVYMLSGALAFTTLLVVLLSVSLYKTKKQSNCRSTGIWYFFYQAAFSFFF